MLTTYRIWDITRQYEKDGKYYKCAYTKGGALYLQNTINGFTMLPRANLDHLETCVYNSQRHRDTETKIKTNKKAVDDLTSYFDFF